MTVRPEHPDLREFTPFIKNCFVFAEYDDFNAVVGSLDEPECITPTAHQYMFDRNRNNSNLNALMSEDIQEQDEDEVEFDSKNRRDSENYQLPELNDMEKGKLMSCMEEIRNIIGDSCSDKRIVDAIMINQYDFTKALDMLLSSDSTTSSTATHPSKKIKVNEVEKGMLRDLSREFHNEDKKFCYIVKFSAHKNRHKNH
jgi:HBS1 N-terminus